MQIDGAVVEEQGVTFAIVVIKSSVLQNSFEIEKTRDSYIPLFPDMPIILMAQDDEGIPTYNGRKDIVQFLADIDFTRIPWKRYTFN